MSFIHFNGKLLKIDIELLTSFDIMLCVLWTRGKKADLDFKKYLEKHSTMKLDILWM